ncbi:HPT phosphotransmitter 4 [Actinidia rufa]|uniref:Histidine-containing phosphotransfer protein n=1 Tax=Actinidia rufa TaxID=165716 RepID=A0A7J0FZS9_9ERIC|nr:HPT phosphotransmitter 4 [Actinidia rufa]
MERSQMYRQLANVRKALFDQGFLDEQFVQLEELQDDANPNFVEEIVTLFYRDSIRLIQNIELALEKSPLDFTKLDSCMHQFKGSTTSCKRTFQQLKKEYAVLKKKLEAYFQLARQIGPVDGACRPK